MIRELAQFLTVDDAQILDVRSSDDYCAAHLKQSCNIPLAQLLDRLHELPTRNQKLKIVGASNEITEACRQLNAKGYEIPATFVWQQHFNQTLLGDGVIESGNNSKRLWRPAPIVDQFVQNYGLNCQGRNALDIGCGVGRDAVFLALHGWHVTAIDYLPATLEKLDLFAVKQQVKVSSYLLDLEKDATALEKINATFDLIIVIRYLHRPLLAQIREKIKPGGFIVYQTFMQGCEKFGKPKNPRYILRNGELSSIFAEFRILIDEVEYLEDGRPTNVFIAQRIAKS